MKKIFFLCFIVFAFAPITHAQLFKNLAQKVGVSKLLGGNKDSLSSSEVANGLLEALQVGIERGVKTVSAPNGFLDNPMIKIPWPEEAKKVETTLRGVGLGSQVDQAVNTMNKAAEIASEKALQIFLDAIKQITFKDAYSILRGGDMAATNYLKEKTTITLTNTFRPIIENALKQVNATKYWHDVFTTYNRLSPFDKVNPDLTVYVTEKALSGLFYELGVEEAKIRKDPLARTTDLLKKVFASK